MPSNFLTLAQYQRMVGNTVRMNPDLQCAWVMAELSDVRLAGGHCYMELLEKDERGGMRARMRAMIWRSTFEPLRRKFLAATNRDIQSGMKVLVCGSANYHEVYGLSFVISDIDPSYTLGDMERLRREILSRLLREGLIDMNKSLSVPVTPQRIAVVSAEGAAGYGDFMNQLQSNQQGFVVYPMLFRAVMQGDRTVPSVMEALDWVENFKQFFDCVVIIRGGGSTTDLNSFDNYDLAARVCSFPLPVVVGIGHERDRTVLDELACVRCKTPTACAAWILERLDAAYSRVVDDCARIGRYVSEAMRGEHLRLGQTEGSLPGIVARRTMQERLDLQKLSSRISSALQGKTSNGRMRVELLANKIINASAAKIRDGQLRTERLEGMLRVLSPENTLKRGYSITRINGHAVSSSETLNPGDIIETTLLNGSLTSTIETIDNRQFR